MGDEATARYVLIDTDAGSDDALAIWMTIAAHREITSPVHILGITCTHGNTSVENVAVNVIRTLRAANQNEIPVYMGAREPIVHPHKLQGDPFHGSDGFGDNAHFPQIDLKDCSNFSHEHGVLAMCRLAKEYEGKVSILALGPLTNLGLACRMDPDFSTRIKNVYVMGGNVEGEGNSTVCSEFNFSVDPEAAYITLKSFPCVYIVPWEVTLKNAISHKWRVDILGTIDSPEVKLLNDVERKILEKYPENWIACDQFAAAAFIDPNVIRKSMKRHCTVELSGNYTRGLMIFDKMGILRQPENTIVIMDFDMELFKGMMLQAVGGKVNCSLK